MIDKNKLHEELTDSFIGYQFNLDYPFPVRGENSGTARELYRNDMMFNRKVKCLVSEVMVIVCRNEGSYK